MMVVPTGPIVTDGMLRRLDALGRLTPSKRRLLNMPVDGAESGAWARHNARGQLRGTDEQDGSAQR